MASLLIAAGALTYDKVQRHREKKATQRENNKIRFAELQEENAKRVAGLPQQIPEIRNSLDASEHAARIDPPPYSGFEHESKTQKEKKGFKNLLKREKVVPTAKAYGTVR